MDQDTLGIVMAGGVGRRLRPLTSVRAKPAVPFGGIYRIIDFTLSNCINSNVRRIYVLTQYKSHSLSHHLRSGWDFLPRRLGQFIDEVPAQMQLGSHWYAGTADAIRQNLSLVQALHPRLVLVLSGDHIYKMDYRQLRTFHDERRACLTVSVIRVPAKLAAGNYGVLEVDEKSRIVGFEEKPAQPRTISGSDDCYASMGIYLFDRAALVAHLDNELADFGEDVIPKMVAEGQAVFAYDFIQRNRIEEIVYRPQDGHRVRELSPAAPDSGYWRDVGTLQAYWQANIDLVAASPLFNLYGERWPFYNCALHLPPAKFVHEEPGRTGTAQQSIVCDGVIVSGAGVRRSVLGPGIFVHSYAAIESSVLMGGGPDNGGWTETTVGRGCRVRNAIIDRHVRLAEGTVIGHDRQSDEEKGLTTEPIVGTDEHLVVVPKGAEVS